MPTRKTTAKKTTASKSSKKATPQRASAKATTKKRASTKKKAPAKKKKKASVPGDAEVTIDRRRAERRSDEAPVASEPKLERRKKVQRRRQIDPTTCERDYSEQEVEFMNALDDYKRKSGRMFPTCSEVLEVIRGLGYVQLSPAELAARGGTDEPTDGMNDEIQDAPELEEAELEAELVG